MKAYLTISHGETSLGTLRMTLRPDIVPKTVDNFVHYLSSSDGKSSGDEAGYRNSTFHRIIPKFMAQGGDFINGDGTGSASIYDGSGGFSDENFILSHSQKGTLSMANSGPNTNGCQFFITFKATAHLDGRHVVFGYVDWREDDESASVLEKLERARTDRRNDRPLEPIRIVDCGVIDEGKRGSNNNKDGDAVGTGKARNGGVGGDTKLAGEAKKNKLMQAYGDVNPAGEDDHEIDLDEDEADGSGSDKRDDASSPKMAADPKTEDGDEIDLDDENDEPEENPKESAEEASEAPPAGKLTKKALLKKRLAALRTKINQSRTLNRKEVRAEASRMGTDEASMAERKRQNKLDRNAKQKEYDTYVVGKLRADGDNGGGDAGGRSASASGAARGDKAEQKRLASLSQPAYDSIRQMNAKADKKERGRHGPDDYYNPEGQFSNYERNLNSVRRVASRRGEAPSATLDSYDPTMQQHYAPTAAARSNNNNSATSERDGAKRLADEMKRRVEKRLNKKQKLEYDAVDVTSINDRNKRFNQKIGRNFDQHTAEIRQNLERGTAL